MKLDRPAIVRTFTIRWKYEDGPTSARPMNFTCRYVLVRGETL
ncbi:hypothetical protein KYC5002_41450 [Archangium violaceum]|nr:hypothetical protein KYC5002_41450 [Archangium gephyra]